MRVIVCGGRNYSDKDRIFQKLDSFGTITKLAHGNASGADKLSNEWAVSRGVSVSRYPADWFAEGRSAGPKRNAWMLEDFKPDYVVAFPGGRGTADMKRRAIAAGVKVINVRENNDE